MRLYVEAMDATVVEVAPDGRLRYDVKGSEAADWSAPTVQERRAVIYAARNEIADLTELIELLDRPF